VGIIREGELVQVGTLDELRHLTRYSMKVATEKPIEGMDALAGVYDVASNGNVTDFNVDTDKMGAVIAHLSGFGIKKLDSTPPSLEELFMKHYQKEGVS